MRKGPPVTAENKQMMRYAAEAIGGTPHVTEFIDDRSPLTTDLLWCEDRPSRGLKTFATLGLSDTPMESEEGIFPTRLELIGACAIREDSFGSILASAAFFIMKTKALHAPGDVILDVVAEFNEKTTVPHLYLTAPYLWETRLRTKTFGPKQVAWLLAYAISQKELSYLNEHGDDAFEDYMEAKNPDIFDLYRRSTV